MKFSRTKEMVIATTVMSLVAAVGMMADNEVVAPVIVDQPKSVNVKAGTRVTFSVNAVETVDSREDFTVTLSDGTALDMIYCAPGSYLMGSPTNELGHLDTEDQHKVILTKGFWMGKYEITQAQYYAVMGQYPSSFSVTNSDGETNSYVGDNKPMIYVNQRDAMDFCEKLTETEHASGNLSMSYKYTLPTEAQWEYACRAGAPSALYNGMELSSVDRCFILDNLAWYGENENFLHPVGLKEPNSWGFYDMLGNVEEICLDFWIADLGTNTVTDPYYQSGDGGVMRGGSFKTYYGWFENARTCRTSFRRSGNISNREEDRGFRVALVPNEYKVRSASVPVLPVEEEEEE